MNKTENKNALVARDLEKLWEEGDGVIVYVEIDGVPCEIVEIETTKSLVTIKYEAGRALPSGQSSSHVLTKASPSHKKLTLSAESVLRVFGDIFSCGDVRFYKNLDE